MSRMRRYLVNRNTVVRVVLRDPEDKSKHKTDPARLLDYDVAGARATYQIYDDDFLDMSLAVSADVADAWRPFSLAFSASRHRFFATAGRARVLSCRCTFRYCNAVPQGGTEACRTRRYHRAVLPARVTVDSDVALA